MNWPMAHSTPAWKMLSPRAGTANGAWLATSAGQHWASKPDWPGSHARPAKAVLEDRRRGPRQPQLVSNPPPFTGQVHGFQELRHQGAIPLLLGLHEAQLPAHLLQVVPAELGVELFRQDGLSQLEGQRGIQGLGQLLQVPLAHLRLLAVRVAPGGVGGVAHVIRVVSATWARVGWCLKGPTEGRVDTTVLPCPTGPCSLTCPFSPLSTQERTVLVKRDSAKAHWGIPALGNTRPG